VRREWQISSQPLLGRVPVVKARRKISRRAFVKGSLVGLASLALSSLKPLRTARALSRDLSDKWEEEAESLALTIRPSKRPKRSFVVSDLPSGRSTSKDCRNALQKTIDEVAKDGGGRVVIPPGEWFIKGPLRLESNIELHLPQGSQLTFSENPTDYLPVALTRWEGVEAYTISSLIYARSACNVAITGEGTISGNGALARRSGMTQSGFDQDKLRVMGDEGVPTAERIFGEGHILPPPLIQFHDCEAALVEGVRIIDMPFWGVHILYSSDVTIRGVSVDSMFGNNDGVDIDSSRRVLVEECSFITGDDCVAIKSGRDSDGRKVGRPSEDIVVRNCHMKVGSSGGVAIGSEMSGGVSNVYVLRCKMDRVGGALNIKSNLDRGGYVARIRMAKVSIEECDTVFGVTTRYHSYRGGRFNPKITDISLTDVWCQRAREGVSIVTEPEGPAEGISLHSLRIDHVVEPITLQNAAAISLSKVTMNGHEV